MQTFQDILERRNKHSGIPHQLIPCNDRSLKMMVMAPHTHTSLMPYAFLCFYMFSSMLCMRMLCLCVLCAVSELLLRGLGLMMRGSVCCAASGDLDLRKRYI